MKVCPKCGYVDLYWKPLHWKLEWEYCHIDDLKMMPEMKQVLEQLMKTGKAEDKYYLYKLAGKGKVHVHRRLKQSYEKELYEWKHH